VTNEGNVDHYPVMLIYGPATVVEITNHSVVDESGNPYKLIYNDALPGAPAIAAAATTSR
jgi:hypothetical protein